MTYNELLTTTNAKKAQVLRDLNKAMNGPAGFLVKAEIERKPGTVAWLYLAKDFCEALAEHVSELIDQADSYEAREISDIFMAYYDDDPDLYNLLPVEAQLFTE